MLLVGNTVVVSAARVYVVVEIVGGRRRCRPPSVRPGASPGDNSTAAAQRMPAPDVGDVALHLEIRGVEAAIGVGRDALVAGDVDGGQHAVAQRLAELVQVAGQPDIGGLVLVESAALLILVEAIGRHLRVDDRRPADLGPVAGVRPRGARLVVRVQPGVLRLVGPVDVVLVERRAGGAEEEAVARPSGCSPRGCRSSGP